MGDRCLVDHVIGNATYSSRYINRHTHRTGVKCQVFLLVPKGDNRLLVSRPGVTVIEGDENDVLSRYTKMQDQHPADFICRITADCPMVPSAMITKAIMGAVKGPWDFMTNAMPGYRTYPDGSDVEVMSAKLLEHLAKNAVGSQREHVTNLLWQDFPAWASISHMFNNYDFSDLKYSVDTEEDFERVKDNYESVRDKIKHWCDRHGQSSAHRF